MSFTTSLPDLDDPTDEQALNVGGDLPPEVMYRPIRQDEADAIRAAIVDPPAPTSALQELIRSL